MTEMPPIPLEEWLACLREASAKLAGGALRFDGTPVPDAGKDATARPGAYIALAGEHETLHLGLSSTSPGCRAIARGLLGLRFDSEMSDKDVMDACAEVINILAGQVKARMALDGLLRQGLPMFVLEPPQVMPDMETLTVDTRLGPVECRLHVYRTRRAA